MTYKFRLPFSKPKARPIPGRIVATPSAYAVLCDPSEGEEWHWALECILAHVFRPPEERIPEYGFGGCPLSLSVQWDAEGEGHHLFILKGPGDLVRKFQREDYLPVSLF